MKDYASMSDSQINEMVHGIIKPESNLAWCFDYCNNPADAWPIIQANGICIGYDGMSWDASCNLQNIGPISDWKSHPEKPLRMAMIVFLMMKEGD